MVEVLVEEPKHLIEPNLSLIDVCRQAPTKAYAIYIVSAFRRGLILD